jgi:hypothetical protein
MLKINKVYSKTSDKIIFEITAPLYWWLDETLFVTNAIPWEDVIQSRIKGKPFTIEDFSTDGLFERSIVPLEKIIDVLNYYRTQYIEEDIASTSSKEEYLQQIIKLLPSCYNLTGTMALQLATFHLLQRWFKNSQYKEWGEFFKCIQKEIE